MKKTRPFYLAVIDKPQTSAAWYKKTPMGKNTINNIMKTMKEDSTLKDVCPKKKLTNHSTRKTVGIPKCEIKNITGHNSEQDLDDYDSTPVMKTSRISCPTSSTMPSLLPLQDKFFIHCHQFKLSPGQLPAMSTISAIAM